MFGAGGGGTDRWLHFPTLSAKAIAHVLGRAGLGKAGASEGLPWWIVPGCSCQKIPFSPQSLQVPGRSAAAGSWRAVGAAAGRGGGRAAGAGNGTEGTPGCSGHGPALGCCSWKGPAPMGMERSASFVLLQRRFPEISLALFGMQVRGLCLSGGAEHLLSSQNSPVHPSSGSGDVCGCVLGSCFPAWIHLFPHPCSCPRAPRHSWCGRAV